MYQKANTNAEKHSQVNDLTMGQVSTLPAMCKTAIVACKFIRKLLTSKGFSPEQCTHMSEFGWRESTFASMGTTINCWTKFCKEKKKNKFEVEVHDIIDFLYACFKAQDHLFQQLTRAKVTLLEMRKLMGKITSRIEVNYLSKFLRACFNRKPPINQRMMTWDVGMLLTYFQYIGNNDKLLCNSLAAKCVLLIMLSTMSRKAEIMQLKLSEMHVGDKDIVFHLI